MLVILGVCRKSVIWSGLESAWVIFAGHCEYLRKVLCWPGWESAVSNCVGNIGGHSTVSMTHQLKYFRGSCACQCGNLPEVSLRMNLEVLWGDCGGHT